MSAFSKILVLSGLVLASAMSFGQTLSPGSKAPELDVKTWYKGTPVKGFEKGKTYVVEFWATWCGPCKTSIPHLSALATANKDVTFIGVSIWEDDNGKNVKQFVDDMGSKMAYNVGYSGNQEGMSVSWMKAAGQNGIPSSFIVKDGMIEWIGHPMEMDKPLAEIKAGTFDRAGFRTEFVKAAEAAKIVAETQKKMGAISQMYASGKTTEAKAALNQLVSENPTLGIQAEDMKFGWLFKEDYPAWEKAAVGRLRSGKMDQVMSVAGRITSYTRKGANIKEGKKLLALSLKETEEKNLIVLYYAGIFCSSPTVADYKAASTYLSKALELFPNSEFKSNTGLKDAMAKMKADAEKKIK